MPIGQPIRASDYLLFGWTVEEKLVEWGVKSFCRLSSCLLQWTKLWRSLKVCFTSKQHSWYPAIIQTVLSCLLSQFWNPQSGRLRKKASLKLCWWIHFHRELPANSGRRLSPDTNYPDGPISMRTNHAFTGDSVSTPVTLYSQKWNCEQIDIQETAPLLPKPSETEMKAQESFWTRMQRSAEEICRRSSGHKGEINKQCS